MKTRDAALQGSNAQLKKELSDKDQAIHNLQSPVKKETTKIVIDTSPVQSPYIKFLLLTNRTVKSTAFRVKCTAPIVDVHVDSFDSREHLERDGKPEQLDPNTWQTEAIRSPYWTAKFPYTITVKYAFQWKVAPSSCDIRPNSE